MPGLKSTLRYLHGSDITREGFKDNKETEKSISLKYIVPTGQFKDWAGGDAYSHRFKIRYGILKRYRL